MSHRSVFISVAALVLLISFSARSQELAPARSSKGIAARQTKAIDVLE